MSSRSARLRIGAKSYKVAVTGSRTIAQGRSAKVRVSVGKYARRALRRRGTGTLTVKLVLRSSNGASLSRTVIARVKRR